MKQMTFADADYAGERKQTKNADTLYKKSIPDAEGKHWYMRDEHGVVHRFGNSNDGRVHWNGDSSQNRGIPVPPEVAKRFVARTITCKCKGTGK